MVDTDSQKLIIVDSGSSLVDNGPLILDRTQSDGPPGFDMQHQGTKCQSSATITKTFVPQKQRWYKYSNLKCVNTYGIWLFITHTWCIEVFNIYLWVKAKPERFEMNTSQSLVDEELGCQVPCFTCQRHIDQWRTHGWCYVSRTHGPLDARKTVNLLFLVCLLSVHLSNINWRPANSWIHRQFLDT